jgi:hypothetical protein
MRCLRYGVAMSPDGFIAGPKGCWVLQLFESKAVPGRIVMLKYAMAR